MFIVVYISNNLIPLVMILGGYFLYYNTPVDRNDLIGYRTRLSRVNQETWKFANKACGRLWLRWGVPVLIVSAVVQLPFIHDGDETVGIMTLVVEGVQLVIILYSIYLVEKQLKATFDEFGNRREE